MSDLCISWVLSQTKNDYVVMTAPAFQNTEFRTLCIDSRFNLCYSDLQCFSLLRLSFQSSPNFVGLCHLFWKTTHCFSETQLIHPQDRNVLLDRSSSLHYGFKHFRRCGEGSELGSTSSHKRNIQTRNHLNKMHLNAFGLGTMTNGISLLRKQETGRLTYILKRSSLSRITPQRSLSRVLRKTEATLLNTPASVTSHHRRKLCL